MHVRANTWLPLQLLVELARQHYAYLHRCQAPGHSASDTVLGTNQTYRTATPYHRAHTLKANPAHNESGADVSLISNATTSAYPRDFLVAQRSHTATEVCTAHTQKNANHYRRLSNDNRTSVPAAWLWDTGTCMLVPSGP